MISETQAKKYCSEEISEIENYAQAVADTTQTWHCHHRLEIQGQFRNSISLLKKCGLYYHVPAWQLVFLTNSEHRKLHNIGNAYGIGNKGKFCGEKNPMFGKCGEKSPWFGRHHSDETRKKLSEIAKHRAPISEETKKKMSARVRGRKWWNNGVECVRSRECPGEGWVRGQLRNNNQE